MNKRFLLNLLYPLLFLNAGQAQHSVARQWNEVLLEAIRNDFARPTVHARNLFHLSVAMYDAWAIFDEKATTYLIGKTVNGFSNDFDGISDVENIDQLRNEAISYACYRLLKHRFRFSPGKETTYKLLDSMMSHMGYDTTLASSDYKVNPGFGLGNFIAESIIDYGLQDGSNEENDYANLYYEPRNNPIAPAELGNPTIIDPNLWQPLALDIIIDQSGNVIPDGVTKFLSPEWGHVAPFALRETDLHINQREGHDYWVYHDPGPPPTVNWDNTTEMKEEYKWGFSLVNIWSAHLDPSDGVMWDISPGNLGNITELPTSYEAYRNFYDQLDGGDPGTGHLINPFTKEPYAPNIVPRGDYTRVLAEFWADGPDSETPPGHWFTILNYVSDHPLLEKRYRGKGEVLEDLEWDVKAYFALGGAMHDAAVTAWGIKGWYDYIRPISAIRDMAAWGQSSNPNSPGFSPNGIPLVPGFIELIEEGDPLEGSQKQNIGKIKLYAWKGPNFIDNPETDVAGVGWIISDIWWPYQRPSFVTPPFAGFVSGHSTFSRAAAEVMTLLTGDAFFPGGMARFTAKKNEFLVFEEGPSVDIELQWATYRDASDQTSLSRIWGGIHPPADDIPGRLIGIKVGNDAFDLADSYFNGEVLSVPNPLDRAIIFPNPFNESLQIQFSAKRTGRIIRFDPLGRRKGAYSFTDVSMIELSGIEDPGLHILYIEFDNGSKVVRRVIRK